VASAAAFLENGVRIDDPGEQNVWPQKNADSKAALRKVRNITPLLHSDRSHMIYPSGGRRNDLRQPQAINQRL
jgi:hypothetical protein